MRQAGRQVKVRRGRRLKLKDCRALRETNDFYGKSSQFCKADLARLDWIGLDWTIWTVGAITYISLVTYLPPYIHPYAS